MVQVYMDMDTGKDIWDALEAKFGVANASTELYIMEKFYDYKMVDDRSVVEQAHEIQMLAKELQNNECELPNKFMAGGIIAKLPPTWLSFATTLKHRRQVFSVTDLIATLGVEENARAKDTHGKKAHEEVIESRDATFFENEFPMRGNVPSTSSQKPVDSPMAPTEHLEQTCVENPEEDNSGATRKSKRQRTMDVKKAFLNGELDEEIYMDQPDGFVVEGQEGKVLEGYCDANWISNADELKAQVDMHSHLEVALFPGSLASRPS
ncbi:uncharacterized protein [Miscanthus floridulus]|uniref:uncharacterized protein n=1 Tax=Miscanthus floridulus TaxID=154761 RepID=UPI003459C68F